MTIANLTFQTHQDVIRYCRALIRNGNTDGEDGFLSALLGMHPRAAEKIGPGIRSFSVRPTRYGTRCFWVDRVDGTRAEWSFQKALGVR